MLYDNVRLLLGLISLVSLGHSNLISCFSGTTYPDFSKMHLKNFKKCAIFSIGLVYVGQITSLW